VNDCVVQSRGPDPLEERLVRALPQLRAHLASKRRGVSGCDVEDVAHEVIARALRYRQSFDSSRALWPWLRRMADLIVLDQHSAAARRPALSDELDPTAPEAPVMLDARDEVERLLAQLPARERDVLIRFHQHGHSVRVIAKELGLPEGTVKSHLSRARRRLASPLGPEANS
jgi:RNA polymerase sigma-70 factor (ECF subfamily)